MIVVTAPTGNIGHRVLDHVLAAGRPVRVVVRDPARLSAGVRDRVEVVQGSHGDPRVVARAFDGADALFWLLPTDHHAASVDEAYLGFTRPAAEAVRSCGVGRVVSVSALGRGTPYAAEAGHVTASLAMDDLLAGTGAAFRALAMPSFMDNLLRQAGAIKEQGAFFDVMAPGGRRPLVATRDIAAVAARLLLDDTWTGQAEVPVLGPEDLSYDDMAAVVSEVLGTPVRYRQIPLEAFKDRLTGSGMSEAMAQAMVDMAIAKDRGLDNGVVRTPENAIDTPTTFRRWCEDTLKPAVRAL
ncbi:NmrA family NAD(P)-binding protein [Microbispora sp. ATCC PTA-5024]|uniref:NmrA family NAD(P)-binding protein n=1 Tax=Microbispora sp. ATCC PTA-5024 TaxID=316330 RepID=UPI0003DD5281|nr:NAD(P)H-binding protein [Microbispora sp. ATCC PTA-5024]ETK32186.1 NmrA family transcriptional regulator [Microbispora sp. ATCC PTA-5024]